MAIRRQCFDQAFLNDIFGQMVIAQPLSSKGYENLEILEDCIFNARHAWEVSFCAAQGNFLSRC